MRTIDYFDRGAEIDPQRMAIVDGDRRWSFAETREISHRIARALYANGIERQAPIALYAPNHAAVLLCLLGMWRAGGIWIPVNTRNAFEANLAYMNYVRTRALFYHSMYTDDVAKLKAAVPSLGLVVCVDKPDAGHPSLDQFLAKHGGQGPIEDWGDCYGDLDDVVGIFPTGGTTGPAKGVNVTNLGWGTMLDIAMRSMDRGASHPVCLVTAPLTHAAGPISTATLAFGATQVIMPGFDAAGVLANIEKHKVTHVYLPPTALYALLDHPTLGDHDYASLQVLLLVGSPVSPDRFRQAAEVFGPCLCQCYGQVESPMITTWLSPEDVTRALKDKPELFASCGRPTYPVRVGIMDDEGKLLPQGETGEIVVRGKLVSRDYFEKPEATLEAHAHGWHHTGDVGRFDEEGYLYIVDRKKDMIVTGGFNVFSAEVEKAVMELPEIRECAVIGVPHDKWGEAVTAVAVLNEKVALTEAAVIAHCKARLGGVKAPKAVHFWNELPKTGANKMDKKAIRREFWKDRERAVN
jgi:acyl-CoA synthetase (AMP-forming)/AMP-acid ligase II